MKVFAGKMPLTVEGRGEFAGCSPLKRVINKAMPLEARLLTFRAKLPEGYHTLTLWDDQRFTAG